MIDQKSYIDANKEISLISLNLNESDKIEDQSVFNFILQSRKILRKYFKKKISLNITQIPRGGIDDYNCDRHMKIFETHNVIPEFCFGCYKILIEPKTVIHLIKLRILFDKITFSNKNFRKCMIEGRKNIDGNYKGFIYCKSLEEAENLLKFVCQKVKYKIDENILCQIKRGCSEYAQSYPNYKNLDKNEMKYKTSWKKFENDFDKINSENYKLKKLNVSSGLTIKDVLIFENWIMYAKLIGDDSYKLIS